MKTKTILKKKFVVFFWLYFIFFSSYFTLITLSKYVGVSTGTSNTAIAKWEVNVDTQQNTSNTLDLVSGNGAKNYILKIISGSEVGVGYTVTLTGIPSQVEVSIDGGSYTTPTNNQVSFTGTFNATSQQIYTTHTLSFRAPLTSSNVSSTSVGINVVFEQTSLE